MLDDDTCRGHCKKLCTECVEDAPATQHVEKLEAEVKHLRAGINAYRSVLTVKDGKTPYSVIENRNILFVTTWEQVDARRGKRDNG